MTKKLFIVVVGIICLVACSSPNKSKEDSANSVASEQIQGEEESFPVEAIDDSGEALAEDTVIISLDDTVAVTITEIEQE